MTQRAVLITGAGSGIGRAAALMLAERGWSVALAGRTQQTLDETGGVIGNEDRWCAVVADIGAPDDAQRVVRECVERFGRIDALVNNAGTAHFKTIAEHTPDESRREFEVNALGPVWAVTAAWTHFQRQGAGCIVNVSSMSSLDPFPGLAVYGAAKAALNSLARGCVNEGASANIRAFTVAPGAVETAMLRSIATPDQLPPERCLAPQDVAKVIVECIEGERDDENGRTIVVPSP